MDALARIVEVTGASIPLAAQILNLVIESGASHTEVKAALGTVEAILPMLPISYQTP